MSILVGHIESIQKNRIRIVSFTGFRRMKKPLHIFPDNTYRA
ncbi:hypothetical protein HMPREF9406_0897 [Clostridium sp. HGF2]|nr:hypothetical protein HMPREF9406_0897 [Clostridium sp. HGF2]